MDSMQLIDVLRQAVVAGAVLVAPVLLTALIVGTLMSLLQAITQIHDQAVSFVPKLIIVGITVFAMLPWMTEYYAEYARDMLLHIPSLVFGG